MVFDGPAGFGDGPEIARLTRREAVQAGAVAVGSLAAVEVDPAAARARKHERAGVLPAGRHEESFDLGWLFHRGDVSGAQAPGFDDSSWRELDVPHDWSIEDLPYATSTDGGATSDPSTFAVLTDPSMVTDAPQVIGPFDKSSIGARNTGYTVGGVGWYRKHFKVPGLVRDERGGAS